MDKPHLSILIPCYNEESNLKRGVLDEVKKYLKRQSYFWEVIVSDDGSTDKSVDFLEKYCQKNPDFILLKNLHGGKPFAIRAGIKKAKGKIVLFTDMDQSTPIKEIEKLLPFFEKNYDVVIGSRGLERKGFSFFRRLASRVFLLFRKALLLRNINDTQCGFKTFKNSVAKDLFSQLLIFKNPAKVKGWRVGAFDVELLFIAQKRGYKIAEVPVEWKDKDIAQGKQRKFLKESWAMLKEILRVKINDIKGLYD